MWKENGAYEMIDLFGDICLVVGAFCVGYGFGARITLRDRKQLEHNEAKLNVLESQLLGTCEWKWQNDEEWISECGRHMGESWMQDIEGEQFCQCCGKKRTLNYQVDEVKQ